jgi:hypothetical protein
MTIDMSYYDETQEFWKDLKTVPKRRPACPGSRQVVDAAYLKTTTEAHWPSRMVMCVDCRAFITPIREQQGRRSFVYLAQHTAHTPRYGEVNAS